LGGNEKKTLYFDSSPKNCNKDNCLADQNHIEFYQLFKFDDRRTDRDYSCENVFLKTPLVPDISYNHILMPSVVSKFEFRSQSFDLAKIHSVSYRRVSGINAILSSGDYMFYGKPRNKNFGPKSVHDIKSEKATQWDWQTDSTSLTYSTWDKCKDDKISSHAVDIYLTSPISSFLNTGHGGVFGLGPKSNFWKWIRSVYLPEHESISASIHYQKTTPENDYQLELATGKYARPSTLMINGIDGTQDMHYFKSSETDWWSYEDVGIQLLGNSTKADPDETEADPDETEADPDETEADPDETEADPDDSDELEEMNNTMVIHKLCFTNIGDNFLYVSNPVEFVKIISKQLCKGPTACDPKKIDLETKVLVMAFSKNTNATPSSDPLKPNDKRNFKFPAKDMVS
jgi:hypothetical protein